MALEACLLDVDIHAMRDFKCGHDGLFIGPVSFNPLVVCATTIRIVGFIAH